MTTFRELSEHGLFVDGNWVESKDQDPEGDVRLVQLADIGIGRFRDRSSRFMTTEKAEELRCTFLEPGDLLIARMPDPIGRACIFPGDDRAGGTLVFTVGDNTAEMKVSGPFKNVFLILKKKL